MKIEVMEVSGEPTLHEGHDECWVRVLSSELMDLERVKLALSSAQKETLLPYTGGLCNYYPHHVTSEEKADHGYSLEEWWVWRKP